MRILLFLFLLVPGLHTAAQDTLYLRRGEKMVVKILEINPDEIVYRRPELPEGPLYRIRKSEADSIRFSTGLVEVFGYLSRMMPEGQFQIQSQRETDGKLAFLRGREDASTHYRGYRPTGTACFAAGFFSIYGLPLPLIAGSTRPRNVLRYVPDQSLYTRNPDYARGFNERALEMKSRKAWSNFGYGLASSAALFVVILIASYP
jgi:hypothetical protein